VTSSQPLGDIFSNKDVFGRIEKWAIELSQFHLNYVPKTAIKSQALVDFMADWTPSVRQGSPTQAQVWILHLGAGVSAVLIAPSGHRTKYAARLVFKATNNIAEYEGLILGLNKVKVLGTKTILAKIDS
jgi:hypothetical protein